MAVPIFLLEMEDGYLSCQCDDLYYLLSHIVRGDCFFFLLFSAAILQAAFLLMTGYRYKKTAYGTPRAHL